MYVCVGMCIRLQVEIEGFQYLDSKFLPRANRKSTLHQLRITTPSINRHPQRRYLSHSLGCRFIKKQRMLVNVDGRDPRFDGVQSSRVSN